MIIILTVILLSGMSSAFIIPERNGIASPGLDAVSLALGGVRSIGFGDPMCLLSNPSCISMRRGSDAISISYGPGIWDISFTDGTETHSDSWVNFWSVYSFGMKVPVNNTLVFGVAAGQSAELPLRTVYYIPGISNIGNMMALEGGFSEAAAGLSWDAMEWLSIGSAIGIRATNQSFEMTYSDTTPFITELTVVENEPVFIGGATLPLEPLTLGISWSSPGKYIAEKLALGGVVDISPHTSAGAELEVATLNERSIYSGRVFGRIKPFEFLILRVGAFYNSYTEEISSEGFGASAGAGYIIGKFTINGAYSSYNIRGDHDYYGYSGLESYEGAVSRIVVGMAWRLN
jgi:hypothetical protein